MRILMISDVYFPRVNGVSTSIQTFAREYKDKGHEVTLIAPDYSARARRAQLEEAPRSRDSSLVGNPVEEEGDGESDEFEIIRIPSRYLPVDPEDRILRASRIRSHRGRLATRGYDLVHIQTPFVAHYAGVRLARRLGVPVIESYHTYFEQYLDKYVGILPASWLRMAARRFSAAQCAGDAFVFASRTETQGLVLLEAMALGVPVVSTAVMGTKEVLEGGKGCVIAADDEADFAAKAVRLLANPHLRASLGEEARIYARSCSAPELADRMLEWYTTVTAVAGEVEVRGRT